MTNKKLHPSIEQFKEFVKKHPKIVREVRTGKSTWQELYEDWYLLGGDDQKWEPFRPEGEANSNSGGEKKTDWMANILNSVKRMDPNELQGYIHNLSQALSAVQGVISQFQGGSTGTKPNLSKQSPSNPFKFIKD